MDLQEAAADYRRHRSPWSRPGEWAGFAHSTRMRKTMRHIPMERDRSFSSCTPKDVIARCAKPGCSDADTIPAALCASYVKSTLASVRCRTHWCLVSVRVLDRGRIIVARADAFVHVAARLPPVVFVNFGDQPRIAVHGVSI